MQQKQLVNFKEQGQGPAVVLIHGLFGTLDNLGLLARALSEQYRVISLDLRNHGGSFHADQMSYPQLAGDVLDLLDALALPQVALVGHSMGGKVAMMLARQAPSRVRQLVVADIAPVAYPHGRHQHVFAGLNATLANPPASRSEADEQLARHIEIAQVRQFLLKSFVNSGTGWGWRFNVAALEQNYANIMGWPASEARFEGPTLFIKGGDSDYMLPRHTEQVMAQFPAAKARIIAGTGHWLHAEKPALFNKLVLDFLSVTPG